MSSFVVLIPLYQDWDAARALLPLLDAELSRASIAARVVFVDDASMVPVPDDIVGPRLTAIRRVDVVTLRRNLGHQRAICIGLCALATDRAYADCDGVVVMDGDGEDRASDIPRLVARFREVGGAKLIFARRKRRTEGLVFSVFYRTYRVLHRILTGLPVRVGNFSLIPYRYLGRLCVVSELWNHYAAAVVHARFPTDSIPTIRGRRLFGRSKMDFVALVAHGLSAMSVFGDRIGVRSLIATLVVGILLVIGLATTIAIRLWTPFAIPGWATTAAGLLTLLLSQSLLLSLAFTGLIHVGRAGTTFLPARDFQWFVERVTCLWKADDPV